MISAAKSDGLGARGPRPPARSVDGDRLAGGVESEVDPEPHVRAPTWLRITVRELKILVGQIGDAGGELPELAAAILNL
jgi:hypothetical protein